MGEVGGTDAGGRERGGGRDRSRDTGVGHLRSGFPWQHAGMPEVGVSEGTSGDQCGITNTGLMGSGRGGGSRRGRERGWGRERSRDTGVGHLRSGLPWQHAEVPCVGARSGLRGGAVLAGRKVGGVSTICAQARLQLGVLGITLGCLSWVQAAGW